MTSLLSVCQYKETLAVWANTEADDDAKLERNSYNGEERLEILLSWLSNIGNLEWN